MNHCDGEMWGGMEIAVKWQAPERFADINQVSEIRMMM